MQTRFTPSFTPLPLKIFLFSILGVSIFSAWLLPYFTLSMAAFNHLYLWQLITYPFVHLLPSTIFSLALNLYLIWIFGTNLVERIRPPLFFTLYFGATISAGLFALTAMSLFHLQTPLFGSSAPLNALLLTWVFLNPEAHLLLFFTLPFKARNLLLSLIAINLLIDLSSAHWTLLFANLGALFFSYFFTLLACRARSPFGFLAPFENTLLRALEKLSHFHKKTYQHTKIFDFKSGEPILNDDQFMDAMLAKISLYGENSLSPKEKKRMQKISQEKSSHQ